MSQGEEVQRVGGALVMPLVVLRVRGGDAKDFLHRVLTSDVCRLEPGQGQPSALLTSTSHVVATLTLLCFEESLLLITPDACADALYHGLDRLLMADDVEVEQLEEGVLGLFGSSVEEDPVLSTLASGSPDTHAPLSLGGFTTHAVCDDHLGMPGLLLIVQAEAESLAWAVAQGFAAMDATSYEVLRVKAGSPCFPHDVNEETLLLEAGQLARVSFDKGCYIGQEPVCRIHNRGQVNRRLVGLVFHTRQQPVAGSELSHPLKEAAGRVTSVARNPGDEAFIGLGYVHRKVLAAGGALRLGMEGESVDVVPLPHGVGLWPPRILPHYGKPARS
ncbi:MAG: folate-binding protein YgfZ [Deltaproteobacteria bacterium]|nr:folate-binding protein YgfZ [Deltaproteobacteria bacterium]